MPEKQKQRATIEGVVPAIYTPFKDDQRIDEKSLQSLADRMASIDGVGAVFCIGHAGEVASLSPAERIRVTKLVAEAVNKRVPVLAGIYNDSLEDSVQSAIDARGAGADIVTIFPPNVFFGGAAADTSIPFHWFQTIAQRAKTEICIFQFPVSSGLGYSTDTLVKLASLPEVVAVKEGSGTPRAYEANLTALKQSAPHVSILTSNNDWWFADLAYGGDGILSGSSPVMPELQVKLWRAMRNSDLKTARETQAKIRPLLNVFYRAPSMDMHNRMKNALLLMGQLPSAMVRPPLKPLGEAERKEIRAALVSAGLLS